MSPPPTGDGHAAVAREEPVIVPRPVVVLIVLVLTGLLVLDVGGQFLPGSTHEASPVLDGALLAILGGVIAASRGPQPTPAPDPDVPTAEPPPDPGRHRAPQEGP